MGGHTPRLEKKKHNKKNKKKKKQNKKKKTRGNAITHPKSQP